MIISFYSLVWDLEGCICESKDKQEGNVLSFFIISAFDMKSNPWQYPWDSSMSDINKQSVNTVYGHNRNNQANKEIQQQNEEEEGFPETAGSLAQWAKGIASQACGPRLHPQNPHKERRERTAARSCPLPVCSHCDTTFPSTQAWAIIVTEIGSFKTNFQGLEMVQQLEAPSAYMVTQQLSVTSSWAQGLRVVYKHTWRQTTYTHK